MKLIDKLQTLYSLLTSSAQVEDSQREYVLARASEGKGLSLEDAAVLLVAPASWGQRIFESAVDVNQRIKGKVVTFYGVVYIHDFCVNDCRYCGDSVRAGNSRRLLTTEELIEDVKVLLSHHDLKEICFLMGEDPERFGYDDLIQDLKAVSKIYHEKMILNIPPLSVRRFSDIRSAIPDNRLHFRVFQETYDTDIYAREHLLGPKKNYEWRVNAQARALEAGFDEVGHGVLYGLNDKAHGHLFDTLAMLAHAQDLYQMFGKRSQSMSFPRIQPAPGINYHSAAVVDDDTLIRCASVIKLTDPQIDIVITCRETASFRHRIRPIVNIEDFAARPGPGGNSILEVRQQMFLPDMRTGEEVREEMIRDGYTVR